MDNQQVVRPYRSIRVGGFTFGYVPDHQVVKISHKSTLSPHTRNLGDIKLTRSDIDGELIIERYPNCSVKLFNHVIELHKSVILELIQD